MKTVFLVVAGVVNFLCAKVYAEEVSHDTCSLAYVHVGPNLPNYVQVAIAQARLFNPEIPIYLLAESTAFADYDGEKERVHLIPLESLTLSESHERFQRFVQSTGLWRYALERFLYLDDFIRQYGLVNVFHTESDVMIYFDLREKLPVFQECYKGMIASVFDCDERSVPSFVYISDSAPLEKFAYFISKKGLEGTTDMSLLFEFKQKHYKTLCDHLPILIPAYAKERPLESLAKRIAKSPVPYVNNIEKFQLIFDAAAIGQFLGGIDPILNNEGPGFVGEVSVFLTHACTYEWQQDVEGRWVPYISYGGVTYPIANLHIHCKDLGAFYSLNPNYFPLPLRAYSSLPMD